MANWYQQERAKANVMFALENRDWIIYGKKEDNSDSWTDYYDPASWEGIATKNGFVLVVDQDEAGTISNRVVRQIVNHKTSNRIEKLQALADNHAASDGEVENALKIIQTLKDNLEDTLDAYSSSDGDSISYQATPKHSSWHIEKDGEIIAKGVGVYVHHDCTLFGSDGEEYPTEHSTTIERREKIYKFIDRLDARVRMKLEKHIKG